ncbi:MAG TPA: MASE3 domain-containing protein [Noviherbaspirillum sp.]|nr:MASE3 domain-containing protein [Noviherbaspirillum sp.]
MNRQESTISAAAQGRRRWDGLFAGYRALQWQGFLVFLLTALFLLIRLAPPHHAFEGVANYAWLHLTLETLSILVAGLVFGVAWNAYSNERAGNVIILAVGLLTTGIIDFMHALAFKGMPDFVTPSDPEKAINFWLAARLTFAVMLAFVALRRWTPLRRPAQRYAMLAVALLLAAAVMWIGLYHQAALPHTFIAGQGLTPLKVGAEYAIIAMLAVPAAVFLHAAGKGAGYDAPSLFAAAAISILAELSFTLYTDVTDIFNLLGHLYKVVAFAMIYRAVFVGSVKEPFERVIEAEGRARSASFYVRSLIEASIDPLIMISPAGRITDVNEAALKASGLSRERLAGSDFIRYFTEPDKARAGFQTVLADGVLRNYPLAIRQMSGRELDVICNATAYRNQAGQVEGIMAALRDITEMRRAERALLRQHTLLAKITETSPIGITVWDTSGKITFANAEVEKVLGRSKDELMRLAYDDVSWRITDYSGNALPEGELPFHRVVATGDPVYNVQMALDGGGGKRILLSVNASPLLGEDGQVEGVVATLDDMTQRKAAEDMLRTSEARLKIVMNAAHMGTWTWDVVNDRVQYSPEYSVLMGLPRGESHPDRAAVLAAIHPGDRERVDAALQKALVRERGQWIDFRVAWADGSLHWLSVHASVARDAAGRAVSLSGIGMDITERKQSEFALNRANRTLRTLSAVNERLIHAQNEAELLQSVCRVIVEVGGYCMAWVGKALQDERKTVQAVAQWGNDSGYIDVARIVWSDSERGRGSTGTAIRTGQTQVNQNYATNPQVALWRDEAMQRGYQSSIAFPLRDAGGVHGALTIYAPEPDAFDSDEVRLLQELANDLAFGIVTLRTGVEHDRMAQEQQHYDARLRDSLVDSIQAIAATLEMRDPYTAGHQRRVAALATAIGREVGLSESQMQGLHLAASIHDVGKIHIPSEILNKPGRLSALELELIKTHAQAGYDILKDIRFPWPIARIVLEHHERLDGSGYPNGLRGEQILRESKILTVADVVEAMTSHRPYRPGLGLEVALDHIVSHRGEWYDPQAVDICVRLFRESRYSFG